MYLETALLAVLVFQEARGEPFLGQVAVAEVVLNRTTQACYPDSVKKVIKQPYQFSGVGAKGIPQTPNQAKKLDRDAFSKAEIAVQYARERKSKYSTATHFHSTGTAPKWAKQKYYVGTVGNHKFYRLPC